MLPKIEWGDAMMRKPGFLYSRAHGPTKMTLFQQVNYNKVYQMYACVLSLVRLFVTPWTVAHQALLSMEFSRQEYWSGLPCPSPGDLPDPGIKPKSLTSPVLGGGFFTTGTTWEVPLTGRVKAGYCPQSVDTPAREVSRRETGQTGRSVSRS